MRYSLFRQITFTSAVRQFDVYEVIHDDVVSACSSHSVISRNRTAKLLGIDPTHARFVFSCDL